MKLLRATLDDLETIVPLFDGYRVFYKQESNLDVARKFVRERLVKKDSVIFLVVSEDGEGMGFTQLYPSFSSVSMQRVFILNDLFVSNAFRGRGIGEALLEHAQVFARNEGSRGLTLETAVDNPAQRLYERLGWKKDDAVFHYTWEI
ncbi:GNAT family N-acetyltransferase [Aureitalea sp. L0-47]|uniref:GNAT family N-acetyltransferase n=1 Tax=Aureitalea sp. L0-47 TaxID=2816962 RepID=UPI002237DE12|nr:GNAT family N-acetyltransferase [Aureitalea sp. L0-47]MCW5519672.1 GNAT family N-acetyltransferase [Aureitalea sp. L0-47]